MNAADALSRGESVPGGPGACAACGHLTLWHGNNGRFRGRTCRRCDCRAFTAPGAAPAADPLAEARRALHLDVTCPACGAGFSKPCRSSSGAVRVQVHAARKRLPVSAPVGWVQPGLFTAGEGA